MERGFEQLIFIAIIVIAGLLDLLVRWARSSGAPRQPEEPDADPVLVEEWETEWDEAEADEGEVAGSQPVPEPVRTVPEPVRTAPARVRIEPVSVRIEPVPVAEAPSPPAAPRWATAPLPDAAPSVAPAPLRTRARRRRGSRWISGSADARRAIVLMSILGPCPGLEPPRRES